jgi:hypothetical protein
MAVISALEMMMWVCRIFVLRECNEADIVV